MPSLVSSAKGKLEELGECVVLANLETGWFAINPKTWARRIERCQSLRRTGPNLIVYRTRSDESRDHHVIPYEVVAPMLSTESLKEQKNGAYRWNLTLANDRLHVSHREGYERVEQFLAARLATESEASQEDSQITSEIVNLRTKSFEGIVEGIARESIVLSRSRSAVLRREALRQSNGICEGCGVNFSRLLNARGLRALQVHHTKQLALRESPEATALTDLAVVCANCHAIIHIDTKASMSIETLKEEWKRERGDA
jgi:predicted HNH restriction endonuclease